MGDTKRAWWPSESANKVAFELTRDRSNKQRACRGLQEVLYVCIIAISLVFLSYPWLWEPVDLWLLSLLLGLVFFCWIAIPNFNLIAFPSSYYILFCPSWLLSLTKVVFSNERQEGSASGWDRWWGGAGRSRRGN